MNIVDKAKALRQSMAANKSEKKKLREPSRLNFAIADSISLLDATAWAHATTHNGFFMSRNYFAALEPVLPGNLSPRYALIYSGAQGATDWRPVAAVYMQIARIGLRDARPIKPQIANTSSVSSTSSAASKKWLAPVKEQLIERAEQQVLVCGNLLAYGQHGVALSHGEDSDAKQVWHAVAEVLYRVRQMEKLSGKTHFVMVKDLHDQHIKQAKILEKLSYRYVETEPNMALTIDPAWKNYDDYLASLASKYRGNARNGILKPIEEAGCVVAPIANIGAVSARIHALYRNVQVNANFRPFELPEHYFPALMQAAGTRGRCTAITRDNVMLGFLISVADGDTAVAYHIGFDREAAETLPIYLRLLHAGIADAISLGCKRISYGRTALEPKAALGAKPQPFGILLRHRQPVINKLIKHMLLGIEHDDAPERNPFKKVQ